MAHLTNSPCVSVPTMGSPASHSPFARLANCGALATCPPSVPFGFGGLDYSAVDQPKGTKRKQADEDEDMASRSPSPTPTGPLAAQRSRLAHQDRTSPARSYDIDSVLCDRSPKSFKIRSKRLRREAAPFKLPLSKLLDPLDKHQLVALMERLVEQVPELETTIASLAPKPTLKTAAATLDSLNKAVYSSFPYTKWGPVTDDYSFSRVSPALDELCSTILQYAHHFAQDDEFLTTTFAFLQQAAEMAIRLPQWDNADHNAARKNLLEALAGHYQRAIRTAATNVNSGKMYGHQVVEEWGRALQQHCDDCRGEHFGPALHAFVECFGWVLGVSAHYQRMVRDTAPTDPQQLASHPRVFTLAS
ncbi:Tethering factor for nuclear proteasome sts1 [Dimargaris xerosporica]|nr:Tethering factor for nuclear proteasome sts1 [Dimargaris xerosporica]